MSKNLVVKLSGKLCQDPPSLATIAAQLAQLAGESWQVTVVHGGGEQLNRLASALGIEQEIVNGRRVTSEATLDLARMVMIGAVQPCIVQALRAAGLTAIGVSGANAAISASKRPPVRLFDRATGAERVVDFGRVGDNVELDVALVRRLADAGFVTVLAPLASDRQGGLLNVNADTVAASTALALGADRLVLLSDVDGIRRDPADPLTRVPRMSASEAQQLIVSGSITNGMLPKVEAVTAALQAGVRRIQIIGRNSLSQLAATIDGAAQCGTLIVLPEAQA